MGKIRKTVKIVLLIVLVMVIAIVLVVHLAANAVLKAGIETVASKTLDVAVTLEDVDFSILAGSLSLQNLVIDNPKGYKHDKLLEAGDIRIVLSIPSLLKDTVNIKEIMLDSVTVTIEQKGVTGNNLQDIIKAIPKQLAKPEHDQKPAKKLHIDKLELTNITVKVKLLPVPGKADTISLTLKPILMTDLGTDDKMDTAKLIAKILMAIAGGVAEQGAGILPDSITNALKSTLSKTAELGKTVVEEGIKVLEEGTDAGKKVLEGVKGLFEPKK